MEARLQISLTHHKDNSASLKKITLEAFVDNPTRSMNVQGCKNVIEQENIRAGVDGSGQSDTSLLVFVSFKVCVLD